MSVTQIVAEHPGYYWSWTNNQWNLEWTPIQGVYSPPIFQQDIQVFKYEPPHNVLPILGRLIGKNGYFMKWITQKSKTMYIFFKDGCFEIWGTRQNNVYATHLLTQHIQHCIQKYNLTSSN